MLKLNCQEKEKRNMTERYALSERHTLIVVELLKQGLTSTQVIKEFKNAGIELTDEEKKDVKSIARGNGLK